MFSNYITIGGLGVIMALVLVLPFSIKKIEEELEAFLLVMGLASVSVADAWSLHLIKEAFREPVMIAAAVLAVGFLFRAFRERIRGVMGFLNGVLGQKLSIALVVFSVGMLSSVITAIIAALVLSEIIASSGMSRKDRIRVIIWGCYAIGLGAALTPIGEPLSTIVVSKLKGAPHNADFWFLMKLLGMWIVPGVMAVSAAAALGVDDKNTGEEAASSKPESSKTIVSRALKVYLFVMALVFLGTGLKPLADATVTRASDAQLYWINSISAVLDNATLAAAEIVPSMGADKILFILMGLLISGGMLIPGNIPNIICSSKLNIKSREWAVFGLPAGLVLMAVYFVLLMMFAL